MLTSLLFQLYSYLAPTFRDTKGGAARNLGEDPKTLLGLLERAARLWPNHGIAFKDQGWNQKSDFVTYAELLREVATNAAKLRAHGAVTPQKHIVLYFNTHRDNIVWFWSVVAAGGVPALLSPLSSNEVTLAGELDNLNHLFDGPTVLTTKQLSRLFRPIALITTITVQSIVTTKVEDRFDMEVVDEGRGREDELATVLFTSGSTGFAKGVEYTHTQLVCSSKLKSAFHCTDSTKTFMSWVSFDHSAALCENHLHALYAGANQVMVPAIDFVRKPVRFWKVLSDHRIAYTFAPNFFVAAATRAINEMDEFEKKNMKLDFSELRVIMCGGEANKTATLDAAERVLTDYGAPKCSIKASYGLSERYYNNEVATSACKTKDGWFDTGDLGMLDDQGNLCIVGRSKEILVINGQKYSSFELEHAIETANISGLTKSYTASFSIWVQDATADSEDIVILFNPINDAVDDSPALRETITQIKEACIRFCRKRPVEVIPLPKQKLPKSTIGKLSRAKLKKSFQAGHFDQFKLAERAPRSDSSRGAELSTPLQKILAGVLCEETGLKPSDLHLDMPIAELNIDSLGYLRVKSSLEKILECEDPISMALLLSCRTIGDLDMMLLSLGTTTTEYDPIVPLVASGSKCPLILCHPGGGEFLTWLGLLKYIPDRPILALRVRGFHKNETPFETIDEMLDVYMDGIKRHQPKGPYSLLGLCFGGMLAFELGKRLEAAGEPVAFCGGIDNPADLTRIQVREKQRNFIIDLLHFFQILDLETALRWEEEMDHIPDEQFTQAIFARFPDGTLENIDLTIPKVETWQRINKNMQEITRSYVPSGKVSKYDLFWVPPLPQYKCSDEQWRHDWLAKWKNHVTGAKQSDVDCEASEGPLRYHRVQGTHFTILRPENIDIFQVALNKALEVRGV
ncbi:Microperfuranone synthase [Lasiodiplodia hormozganensis]|uniref:Microperfuranone synthase n=1 Tax=Lasiodiplodia hormozganensis TaxID=869390 RepID=A0AA39YTS4_9PEZI|nr:Microperfuranone synthase [Lasiodiplodia hormozganensis]